MGTRSKEEFGAEETTEPKQRGKVSRMCPVSSQTGTRTQRQEALKDEVAKAGQMLESLE